MLDLVYIFECKVLCYNFMFWFGDSCMDWENLMVGFWE